MSEFCNIIVLQNACFCDIIKMYQCHAVRRKMASGALGVFGIFRALIALRPSNRGGNMCKAIRITAKKTPESYDLGASKFFGTPTVPLAWDGKFCEDEIFFCQIKLSDIAHLDSENRLPHTGYLYIFLHTEDGKYRLGADVRYFDGEPELAIDEFNAAVDDYEKYTEAYLMEFSAVDEDAVCTRLFGVPSDWSYADEPPGLLLQYDPLDSGMDFLDTLDGFLYFFFGEDEKAFGKIILMEEYT